MKKLLALLLTVILVMSTVIACGGTGKDEEKGKTDSERNEGQVATGDTNLSWEEVKAQMPESLKGTEITIYNWNEAKAATGVPEAIRKFERETGIKVNWVTGSYNEYTTKISAMVTGGDSPDLVRLRDTDFAVLNLLTPLDEVNYNFSDQAWNHEFMEHYKVNGKYYAACLDETPFFQPSITYYNKNLITKYGLEDPYTLWKNGEWTWDKCMDICADFLDAAGDDYNGMTLAGGGDYVYSLGASFFSYDPEKSQYVSNMSDTKLIKGWQYVASNISKGLIMKDVGRLDDFDNGIVLFCNDSIIGARTSHFFFQNLKDQGALGTVPMPAVDGQEEYKLSLSENEAYGIPKGAKNPEAAAYFLRYYLDAAHYDMDSFYYDDQAAEVAEWCKEQTIVTHMDRIIFKEQYGDSFGDMSYRLRLSQPAQIKTILDSYHRIVDMVVQTGNKALAKLEK